MKMPNLNSKSNSKDELPLDMSNNVHYILKFLEVFAFCCAFTCLGLAFT
jgi:hypothetical protein